MTLLERLREEWNFAGVGADTPYSQEWIELRERQRCGKALEPAIARERELVEAANALANAIAEEHDDNHECDITRALAALRALLASSSTEETK
jgi:hypothetical protein